MNHFRDSMEIPMTRLEIEKTVNRFREVYASYEMEKFAAGYLESLFVTLLAEADSYTKQWIMNRLKDHIAEPMVNSNRSVHS